MGNRQISFNNEEWMNTEKTRLNSLDDGKRFEVYFILNLIYLIA